MLPKPVKQVAELARGKGARIVGPNGEVHRVLGEKEQGPAEALDALEKLAELDSQIRATVAVAASLAERIEAMSKRLDGVLSLVQAAAEGQEKFVRDLEILAEVMKMPLEPVYNEKGILVGARRVPQLGLQPQLGYRK